MTSDRELLLRALDDDLSPDEARALDARLADEANLRREYDTLRALTTTVADGRPDGFAPGFADRVMEQVAPPRARIFTLRPAVGWAVAASLLVAVALGVLLWNRASAPVLLASADAEVTTWRADDGSTVLLRPPSTLYRTARDGAHVRYRLEGEGFFAITHDPSRTVAVEAGPAVVTVLGTRFAVRTDTSGTDVYLEQGVVALEGSAAASERVTLAPGQRAAVTADGTVAAPAPAEATAFTDWLSVSFEQEPLRAVFDLLAQRFGLTLTASPRLLNETLSGSILLAHPQQALADLAIVAGGEFEQTGPQQYRFVRE